LTWVAGQSFQDLEDAMDCGPWHVLHFIGHGGFDQATGEGTIALAGEDGRSDPVGAEDLSRLLGDHYPLRLVVLNACDTGRANALDAFPAPPARWSVAPFQPWWQCSFRSPTRLRSSSPAPSTTTWPKGCR
jgi:CHAT domain